MTVITTSGATAISITCGIAMGLFAIGIFALCCHLAEATCIRQKIKGTIFDESFSDVVSSTSDDDVIVNVNTHNNLKDVDTE